MRYINRIELPLPIESFQQYILTGLQIADGIPQGIAEFFTRAVVPKPDEQFSAIISSTMEKPSEKILPYIFDIDVFMPAKFDPDAEEIWSSFERMRNFKNDIFFCSMTEKAKSLFR